MMIIKNEFISFIHHWVMFHNKRFDGKDEQEEQAKKRAFVDEYYDSFRRWTLEELEKAFKSCRDKYDYFPKIAQVHKERPHRENKTEERQQVKTPVPKDFEQKVKQNSLKGKISARMLIDIEAMLKCHPTLSRPPGIVDETMKRIRNNNA